MKKEPYARRRRKEIRLRTEFKKHELVEPKNDVKVLNRKGEIVKVIKKAPN